MRFWRLGVALVLVSAAAPAIAHAQSITTEADVSVGRSTDHVNAAAIQVRLFGATRSDWRVFLETTWGLTTSAESAPTSDAFDAAYPYDRRVRPMEAFTEKTFHPGRVLVGVRAGRYRTPFGISGRSDHAYVGFLRAPLIRYGENFALSNTFMEAGANVLVGTPSLQLEASLGTPLDEGEAHRRRGLDTVIRAQTYYHSLILGASYLGTPRSDPRPFALGRMAFQGLDGRWMRGGVQLRGEWIVGRPFDGVETRGGYLDVLVHELGMGPVTAVGRIERLDYDAGRFSRYLRRLTAGAHVRVTRNITAQLNLLQPLWRTPVPHRTALDVGLTYSRRF
jgi:hypothetical protein